jgi:lipoyl(octanoyl) transferase
LENGAKIAALGLRVRHGCSFHGLALNLDLELEPFNRINPCGYAGQPVTRLADLVTDWHHDETRRVEQLLLEKLASAMTYGRLEHGQGLPVSASGEPHG